MTVTPRNSQVLYEGSILIRARRKSASIRVCSSGLHFDPLNRLGLHLTPVTYFFHSWIIYFPLSSTTSTPSPA